MCRFHVILLSRIMPRYLTVSLFGIGILFMVTCGQDCFRSVKVIRLDLFPFILKRYLWNHFSIESKPRWRVEEAIVESEWDANKAVSSATVVVVVSVKVGKSAV